MSIESLPGLRTVLAAVRGRKAQPAAAGWTFAVALIFLVGLAAGIALMPTGLQAQNYAWDPGNTQSGGSGTWDTSTTNWDPGVTVPTAGIYAAWVNSATNNAWIGYETVPSPGVITLNTSIIAAR